LGKALDLVRRPRPTRSGILHQRPHCPSLTAALLAIATSSEPDLVEPHAAGDPVS